MLSNGKDRLLEKNSFREGEAEELLDLVRELDTDESLEEFLKMIFEHFRVDMEYLAPRSYFLRTRHENSELFSAIPDGGISVTFDRKKALSREDFSFLSWDHPIVTGTIDMILSSGKGAVSYGVLRSDEKSAILLEFMFVVETIGGKSLNVDRFLPSTPIRLVTDHTGRRVTKSYPSADLEQNLVGGDHDEILENESFEELMFPKMMSEATSYAERKAQETITDSVKIMKSQLGYEINRLNSLSKKNSNIRPEELELAKAEMDGLEEIMNNAQVRLDALRLIKVG